MSRTADIACAKMDGSFDLLGEPTPESPVVVSVPHAGRDYPLALRAALRVPEKALVVLEDRFVDAVALVAHRRETMLVQRRARAWIDLNRAEDERDPQVDEGARSTGQPIRSAKIRSGLGLVPRRAGAAGDLWRRRFAAVDVEARIASDHRPYHRAVDRALAAARARFGVAVLLDIHSMPPLATGVRIVVGDRFGRSAATRFVARVEGVAGTAGLRTALNTPYAGGHILDRHGAPARDIHAIQLEIDRTLYLDAALDQPGAGLPATAALVRAIIDSLADEALGGRSMPFAIAAE
ncbi:N-formylglutamate amidohydrolase [Sphingomonas jinjuensis]|uniref:N-formylglutamate amidohydrolase n=1 Tax=Sphingomonas jinjuensis TaxID=535907 RepID=A0A840F707_9SPHN|nr:N-formylglutamate amidohydrolase [Sphingomonas jinjuensis]MBB4153710.1 N-formylglutamate amidohydrolase [Sphingomonas jinjuensis]